MRARDRLRPVPLFSTPRARYQPCIIKHGRGRCRTLPLTVVPTGRPTVRAGAFSPSESARPVRPLPPAQGQAIRFLLPARLHARTAGLRSPPPVERSATTQASTRGHARYESAPFAVPLVLTANSFGRHPGAPWRALSGIRKGRPCERAGYVEQAGAARATRSGLAARPQMSCGADSCVSSLG